MSAMNIVEAAGKAAGTVGKGRHGRRRAATRAALVQAAQQLIAEGRTENSCSFVLKWL